MIEAVIFDMDGLLADTETIHAQSWIETFREQSVELSMETYRQHWIRDGKGAPDFIAQHSLKFDYKRLLDRKFEIFASLLSEMLRPMPGSNKLLEEIHAVVTMGLASGSRRLTLDLVLKALNMNKYFHHTVAHEDVENPKPHPEGFLAIAERLQVEPARCVVLEDAEKGVLAAHAAGMKCIAVPSEHTYDNDFSKAAVVVESLEHLSWERISDL